MLLLEESQKLSIARTGQFGFGVLRAVKQSLHASALMATLMIPTLFPAYF